MANIVNMRHRPELRRLLDRCPEHGGLVRIDRRTRWGNPFRITPAVSRVRAVALYREDLWRRIRSGGIALEELAGLHGKDPGVLVLAARAGLSRRGPRARRRMGRGPTREDLTMTVLGHGAAPA